VCIPKYRRRILNPGVRVFRKAGIEDGTFHDLRSTRITEWLEKGLLPHEVQKLAGSKLGLLRKRCGSTKSCPDALVWMTESSRSAFVAFFLM